MFVVIVNLSGSVMGRNGSNMVYKDWDIHQNNCLRMNHEILDLGIWGKPGMPVGQGTAAAVP